MTWNSAMKSAFHEFLLRNFYLNCFDVMKSFVFNKTQTTTIIDFI